MNSEAHAHKLEDNLVEANARLAEMERTQTELNTAKIHLTGENTQAQTQFLRICCSPVFYSFFLFLFLLVCTAENNDLSRELQDVQSKLTQVTRLKASLTSQIDELKRQVDEESKVQVNTNTHTHTHIFSQLVPRWSFQFQTLSLTFR